MPYIITTLLTLILLSGCASTTYVTPIKKGKIDNPHIIITAQDKSFTLQGDFNTPFQSSTKYNSLEMRDFELPKAYKLALVRGAKHITINFPNRDKQYYGVLALDLADKDGIGPSVSSYKIIVPEAYIEAAKDGKISVVYEYYHLKNDGLLDVSEIKERSWILWFSDKDVFQ